MHALTKSIGALLLLLAASQLVLSLVLDQNQSSSSKLQRRSSINYENQFRRNGGALETSARSMEPEVTVAPKNGGQQRSRKSNSSARALKAHHHHRQQEKRRQRKDHDHLKSTARQSRAKRATNCACPIIGSERSEAQLINNMRQDLKRQGVDSSTISSIGNNAHISQRSAEGSAAISLPSFLGGLNLGGAQQVEQSGGAKTSAETLSSGFSGDDDISADLDVQADNSGASFQLEAPQLTSESSQIAADSRNRNPNIHGHVQALGAVEDTVSSLKAPIEQPVSFKLGQSVDQLIGKAKGDTEVLSSSPKSGEESSKLGQISAASTSSDSDVSGKINIGRPTNNANNVLNVIVGDAKSALEPIAANVQPQNIQEKIVVDIDEPAAKPNLIEKTIGDSGKLFKPNEKHEQIELSIEQPKLVAEKQHIADHHPLEPKIEKLVEETKVDDEEYSDVEKKAENIPVVIEEPKKEKKLDLVGKAVEGATKLVDEAKDKFGGDHEKKKDVASKLIVTQIPVVVEKEWKKHDYVGQIVDGAKDKLYGGAEEKKYEQVEAPVTVDYETKEAPTKEADVIEKVVDETEKLVDPVKKLKKKSKKKTKVESKVGVASIEIPTIGVHTSANNHPSVGLHEQQSQHIAAGEPLQLAGAHLQHTMQPIVHQPTIETGSSIHGQQHGHVGVKLEANSRPVFESPHVRELPERCQNGVRELQSILGKLIGVAERLYHRLKAERHVSFMTRDVLVSRLETLVGAAETARMGANLAKLRTLSEKGRIAGLEAIRLAGNEVVVRLEPELRPLSAEVRRLYGAFRRACRPAASKQQLVASSPFSSLTTSKSSTKVPSW